MLSGQFEHLRREAIIRNHLYRIRDLGNSLRGVLDADETPDIFNWLGDMLNKFEAWRNRTGPPAARVSFSSLFLLLYVSY